MHNQILGNQAAEHGDKKYCGRVFKLEKEASKDVRNLGLSDVIRGWPNFVLF